MSSNDPNKPTGKRGQRNRKAEPRSRKPAQKQGQKADQKPDLQESAKQLIDATIAKADLAPSTAAAPPEAASTDTATAVETLAVDAAAPVETVLVDAVVPEETVAFEAITPPDTAPIDAVAPADIVTIDAAAPAEIVPVNAMVPANTVSTEAVALAFTFSINALVPPADAAAISFQTIANAYGDYARKSCDETRSFVERLRGVRSLDEALGIQAEFATQAYLTFLAESQKIFGIYRELARQSFRPLERLAARAAR
jgi:hypothetical protein